MDCKIFYSWQSDLHNSLNRSLIQNALENAIRSLKSDDSIELEPVLDRDTAGVPGSPNIAQTIFEKIAQSQIFVCDVSIIYRPKKKKPTPNPNVLIELGYAIKALGDKRTILVMNKAYGGPELLPFDLKQKRVIAYSLSDGDNKAEIRRELAKALETAIRSIIDDLGKESDLIPGSSLSPVDLAIEAIENSSTRRSFFTNTAMRGLFDQIIKVAPDYLQQAERDDLLVESIDRSLPYVIDFSRLSKTAALLNDPGCAMEIHKSFAALLTHYYPASGFSGTFYSIDHDFYKFIGHELYVNFISHLLSEDRFDLLSEVLEEGFYIENSPDAGQAVLTYSSLSEYVELLAFRKNRLKIGKYVHSSILQERYSESILSKVTPWHDFIDADFFLYLKTPDWRPWSGIYIDSIYTPRFLVLSSRNKYAKKLLHPLRLNSLKELRDLLIERRTYLKQLFSKAYFYDPLARLDIEGIGTK